MRHSAPLFIARLSLLLFRLKFFSHPPCQKVAVLKTYVYRAVNISSSPELLSTELDHVKAIATDRDYSTKIIDSIFRKFLKPVVFKNVSSKIDISTSVVLQFFLRVSQKIFNILKGFNFRIILSLSTD